MDRNMHDKDVIVTLSPVASGMAPPVAADRVDGIPSPAHCVVVESFDFVRTGKSAMLRVRCSPAGDPERAVLLVSRGKKRVALAAIPSPLSNGAIGFICDRLMLAGQPSFWLQIGSAARRLPQPEAPSRALAAA